MTVPNLVRWITGAVVAIGLGAGGAVTASASASASAAAAPAVTSPRAPAGPGTTGAAGTAGLAALKVRCNDAVQRRLGTLGADMQFIRQSTALTTADRTALEGQVSADQTGLTALDATIQADPTIARAHADCRLIVDAYHVYVLEDPKIHAVIAADGITGAATRFTGLEPQLQALITNSSASSAAKAAAQNALDELAGKVTAATTSISGVSASVIGLTASGYPGNAVVLHSAASNIATARDDLKGARRDVDIVLHQLGKP